MTCLMLTRKNWFLALLVMLALWLGWKTVVLFARSQERQVLDAQEKLIRAVERRDWEAVKAMLTRDYSDEAGYDRETAVDDGRQALAHFFTLTIAQQVVENRTVDGRAELRAMLRLDGNGAGFSQTVVSTVNGMTTPWVFHWRKEGAWPWSWRVSCIHHEELAARAGAYR